MSVFQQFSRYKDIVLYRTIAGIKSEGRQNYLGYIWFLFEPLLNTAVLYFAWSMIYGSKGYDAILTILVGMVAWSWFEGAVMSGAGAIRAKYHLLNNFNLPKFLFPLVSILVTSWKSMFVFLVLILMSIAGGHAGIQYVWLPVVMALQMFLIVAVAIPVSIGVTLMNDLQSLVSSLFRLLFFVSGLFFTAETVREKSPELYEWFIWNPVAVLIESYRAILVRGVSPDPEHLAHALVVAIFFMVPGMMLHRHYDKRILKMTNG